MKVLWFEVTPPARFKQEKEPIAGWQDSLEEIVRSYPDIELGIAFEYPISSEKKTIEGVMYYPITPHYTYFEKRKNKSSWNIIRDKVIQLSLNVIEDFNPDIIHIFGSEWPFGQIAKFTKVPVVIHMQGSIPPYNNAMYPPMYSIWDEVRFRGFNVYKQLKLYRRLKKEESQKIMEEDTLRTVQNYMGRTDWDKSLIKLYNPKAKYFHCNEALRTSITECGKHWTPREQKTIKLFSTGCGSFWKGMDTILRTAVLLKERNVDFQWNIAGKMTVKKLIETKEKKKFSDYNIKVLGYINSELLREHLLSSDIYIHPAYIDNSPNSICEAQYLGVPIIATYVGGIPSLIENHKDGLLIPANAPHILANAIMELAEDKSRQLSYSKYGLQKAQARHDKASILNDLLECYKALIDSSTH